jgi:hypothetical protein
LHQYGLFYDYYHHHHHHHHRHHLPPSPPHHFPLLNAYINHSNNRHISICTRHESYPKCHFQHLDKKHLSLVDAAPKKCPDVNTKTYEFDSVISELLLGKTKLMIGLGKK